VLPLLRSVLLDPWSCLHCLSDSVPTD
jgi:hypothetical protein